MSVVVDGSFVTYRFGPRRDLDIRFSPTFTASAGGLSYDDCCDHAKLVLQLLCHAVDQIQSHETGTWSLDKIEETGNWEYDPESKCDVFVVRPFTCARFQLKAGGILRLTLREGADCDYVVEFFDPGDESWMFPVLNYAGGIDTAMNCGGESGKVSVSVKTEIKITQSYSFEMNTGEIY